VKLITGSNSCASDTIICEIETSNTNSIGSCPQKLTTSRLNDLEKIKLFPNPTDQLLNLVSNNPGNDPLFSPFGKEVKSGSYLKDKTTLDLSNLSTGTNVIQLIDEKGKTSQQKFILW
jgi:hypothetical protein